MNNRNAIRHRISIRSKTTIIVFIVSVMAVLLSATVAFWGMQRIKASAADASRNLGHLAATHSESALIAQAESNLQEQVKERGALTEQKLDTIGEQVSHITNYMTNVYSHAEGYPGYRVQKPDIQNAGKLVMQYGLVEGVQYGEVAAEINLAGNLYYIANPLCAVNEKISAIYLASENGFMISYDKNSDNMFQDKPEGAPAELLAKGYDPRNTQWYEGANKTEKGKVWFTPTYMDAFGRLMISCAAPVYSQSENVVAVVAMDILVEDINTEIISAKVGQNGFAFLINSGGEVVTSPLIEGTNQQIVTGDLRQNPTFAPLVGKMMIGREGIYSFRVKGETMIAAYAPVLDASLSIAMLLPKEEVIAPAVAAHKEIIDQTNNTITNIEGIMHTMIMMYLVKLVVIVVCVIVAAGYFSKWLTGPIHHLVEDVNIISQGKLDHVVEVHTNDEMEDLGEAFNHMTKSLSEYMTNLATVQADRERIATELSVATSIQASMLPCIFPPFPDRKEFDIFADMNPAKEVGGDFYDFFLTDDNHLWVVMADVSGKGVPAALFMVITKTMLKNHAAFATSPASVLTLVNEQLCENNDAGMFVTTFMGVLEISTGQFTFSNAGHNAPLVYRKGEQFQWLNSEPSFVLAGLTGMRFDDETISLHNGDILFLYTDGVTEALNQNEELYGEERLIEKLNEEGVVAGGIKNILQFLNEDIVSFAAGAEQADDITMMALYMQEG